MQPSIPHIGRRGFRTGLGLGIFFFALTLLAQTNVAPAQRAEKIFLEARALFQTKSNEVEVAWHFARACFDWADFAKNDEQREQIAEQGIRAARIAVGKDGKLAAAHYYLGMNLAQLARTKMLGALRILKEMEREFTLARELDENFDFAGADRNLGLLYFEAPGFSVGDKNKGRQHLERAVVLSGGYPENRLNLIEVCLKSDDLKCARNQTEELDRSWTEAKTKFSGVEWASSWADWEKRRELIKRRLKVP